MSKVIGKPERSIILVENIPDELKDLNQWVCWYWKPKGEGYTKPLLNPKTSKSASHSNPDTWGTFQQAFSCFSTKKSIAGIGFVFSDQDPYCGIDIDDCINQDGTLTHLAEEIISSVPSYCEISPSGKGLKIWAIGKLPGPGFNNRKLGLEMYDRERYFTVTGNIYRRAGQ